MVVPYTTAKITHYGRLFPKSETPFKLEAMEALGASMNTGRSPIPDALQATPLPAGYTYFGQFVAHDLSCDDTTLADALSASAEQSNVINYSTGRLDLTHLYGDGPGSPRHGYLFADDGASFRLGDARDDDGSYIDFPMGKDGAESADYRNTENLILRQLCVSFLKLHNCAVQELPPTLSPLERFQRARTRVCWQYQWLVREDYLFRLAPAKVYREVIERGQAKVAWRQKFSIPVEFSHAAFRFGHSMVRSQYDFSERARDVPLRDVFAASARTEPIRPEMAIDWNNFLGSGRPLSIMPSLPIDTNIAPPLFHLPAGCGHRLTVAEVPPPPRQLPVLTLQRGAGLRIATGEEVSAAFGHAKLRQRGHKGGSHSWSVLDELGLQGQTPLWYYVLLEAELERDGLGLGTTGSQLVLEVIEGCLRNNPNSYLTRLGSNWKPPPWKNASGKMTPIRRLSDLATVTN